MVTDSNHDLFEALMSISFHLGFFLFPVPFLKK